MRSPERLTELLESTEAQVVSLIHQRERILKNTDDILARYGRAMVELEAERQANGRLKAAWEVFQRETLRKMGGG
jgi:hypothetical protein